MFRHQRLSSQEALDEERLLKKFLEAVAAAGPGSHAALSGLGADDHPQYLTAAEGSAAYAALAHTHTLVNVTDVTMTVANLNTLDDGANTALHFHDADRARANHTGTQTAATISDFSAAADARIAAASVNALADVIVTAPATGQVLKYNGTNWVNDTDSTGGGGTGPTRITIAVPANTVSEYASTVAHVGATATDKIVASLAYTGDDDENGLDELEDMGVFGVPTAGNVTFTLTHTRGVFSGAFKVDYTLTA